MAFDVKSAIYTATFAALVSGIGWFGTSFVEAKQDQIMSWADKTYLKIATYEQHAVRREIRAIKKDIFELLRVQEQRPLTDLEARRLDSLRNELVDLENQQQRM